MIHRNMLLLLVALWCPVVSQQSDTIAQTDLLARLAAPSMDDREFAVRLSGRIPPDRREPELRRALIAELQRVNEVFLTRRRQEAKGAQLSPYPVQLERYQTELVELVSQSIDDGALPALVGSLGKGWIGIRGTARFGEDAIEPLAEVALNEIPDIAPDAIRGLQLVLEASKYDPISARGQARIIQVATERLTGIQHVVIAMAACDLAVSTGDPGLRARVLKLSSDAAAVSELGITGRNIDVLQRVAQRALSAKR